MTRGGAGPPGVSISTAFHIYQSEIVNTLNITTSPTIISHMTKYLGMSQSPQSQLAPITVRKQVFERVECGPKQPFGFMNELRIHHGDIGHPRYRINNLQT